MKTKVIQEFLKTAGEPFPDSAYGEGYRCSAYLTDGTYLPCVILRASEKITSLAIRRFDEEKKGKGIFRSNPDGYKQIVKHFVTSGNHVNSYDISKLAFSRFAIPLSLLKQVEGETTMSWTGFVFEMRDGRLLPYGTTFDVQFFNIPEEYTFADVVAVHNHSYVTAQGELRRLVQGMSKQPEDYDPSAVFRERPYFTCYYDA